MLTIADRAAFAAYCQAYGRWVEAEEHLQALPAMIKTPSNYVQQNPWLGMANRQLKLMGRFAVELGLTPSSRSWVSVESAPQSAPMKIIRVITGVPRPDGTPMEFCEDAITDQ